ncbi:protein-L-isoaspartate(D-aspartate) O-methyltransferase [Sphingobium estronivorans]|uniref:protein-L-isoaspartate(D-aspartate) O-methyltransferase n=1 Tax=Sphingobium estronivorans TaxID=1577690 RepID=UPI00123C0125|nr:protein-L-isoaspartate(D-aspartate) O-methyltransferase [Sphingobium estronivorans]
MTDYARLRDQMVDRQIAGRGIRDARVLAAMRTVPRECFVREGMEEFAYKDAALPIEQDQTISQPYIVALMLEAAEVQPGARVLEVGAGSGYAAALLSRLADRVFAIERHDALGLLAKERMAALGYANVEIRVGDGTRGLPPEAPFDAILVAAGAPAVPEALRTQLKVGGHLIVPVGGPGRQRLCKITRKSADRYVERDLGAVMFVPLIGEQGWRED